MKNVFDSKIYTLPVIDGQCFGCDSQDDQWTREVAEAFIKMTGHSWDKSHLLGYFLRKDCHSLGVEGDDVPVRIELCLPCAVEYMTQFNALFKDVRLNRMPE